LIDSDASNIVEIARSAISQGDDQDFAAHPRESLGHFIDYFFNAASHVRIEVIG
jgi:hypothetical protein